MILIIYLQIIKCGVYYKKILGISEIIHCLFRLSFIIFHYASTAVPFVIQGKLPGAVVFAYCISAEE